MEYISISEGSGSAIVSTPPKKKFKCPYCDQRFERQKLHIHIQDEHEDLIPEGYTALRVAFNTINNKTEGHCIICKNVTDWNEDKGRYERLCNNSACHEAYKRIAAERNKRIYGTDRLQTDPKYADYVQRKALAGRKMAGKYKFADGGEIQYLGTYERKLLEFMDTVMHCKSEDIIAPGPSIEYQYEGSKHLYIPDFYYEPYELIIEIKDGGSNPNTHPKRIEEENRNKAKEDAVRAGHTFNYVRVVNNDFGQLLSIMAVIKFQMVYHKYYYPDPVIMVHEDYYTDGLEKYNVLPDNIDNIKDLLDWKDRFNNMSTHDKKESEELSVDLYCGTTNSRFNKKFNKLISLGCVDDVNYVSEDMSGTIGAALPLTPSPVPYESDKDNYYIIQHPQNNVFAYGITKDPVQNIIYGVDPLEKGFYKAYKTDKSKIDKRYLTFKIKDSQTAKELYDELALLTKSKKSKFHDDRFDTMSYIYGRLTEGSKIINDDQLLFDSRFELVRDPKNELEHSCQEIYNYLKGPISNIDLLESQIESLSESSSYQDYNVMPEDIDNVEDLLHWKISFDSMPYNRRLISNDLSTDLYGLDNINRFNKRYAELMCLLDPITNKEVNPEDTRNEIEQIMRSIDNISESVSSEIPVDFYDHWEDKIQKVKNAESQGLIIMILPDMPDINYTEESISAIKDKWNKLQSLNSEKRVLSNQTASSIFGIDNDGLYNRILSVYTSKFQEELKGENNESPNEDNSESIMKSITTPVPYFTPDEVGDYTSANPEIINKESGDIDYFKYSKILTEYCLQLRNCSDKEKRELLKSKIYSLGWNPEIPYSESAAILANLRYIPYSNIQELDAEEVIKEAAKSTSKKLTSEYLKDKIVPIFIILCHGASLFSKGIMWYTNSEWSHAALCFDSSLDKMYTFNINTDSELDKNSKHGFCIDTVEKYKKANPNMKIKVYALFITPEQKSVIQDAIQWYIDHKDETRYAFRNIVNILFKKETHNKLKDKYNMVCSQFVYTILKLVNFKLKQDKDSSLVSPSDIDLSDDPKFYTMYQGDINNYNRFKVDDLCYKLLPALPMDIYGINESTKEQIIIPKSAIQTAKRSEIDRIFEIAKLILN